MALKVKAKEQFQNIGKYAGQYRYVMMPELYTALTQDKVIKEAALRSGVSRGVMQACWDAAGEVIKAWATEGHSVALPGLGTMRFGLRAKSVDDVNKVKAGRIMGSVLLITFEVFVLHIVPAPCALPSVQLFSNAKAKIRTYSRTSKFSTQKNDQ